MEKSLNLEEISRKVNIFTLLSVITLGLIGHYLTILVYSKKKFRTNSGHIYLLCLAVFDSLFLIIHFFEDTIRTIQNVYLKESTLISNNQTNRILLKKFMNVINLTDKFDFPCILVNYLRYSIRFASAYIIVIFTIQRLLILKSPLSDRFKSKKSAWKTILIISIISLTANLWVPFMFKIKAYHDEMYCDVDNKWKNEYFRIAIVYIILIMLIPILLIIICNSFIISLTKKADLERKKLQELQELQEIPKKKNSTTNFNLKSSLLTINKTDSNNQLNIMSRYSFRNRLSSFNLNSRQLSSQKRNRINNSTKITKMLVLVSFSYAFLNLPYLIIWSMFFIQSALKHNNETARTYLFSMLQISEIFYILNYGVYFYINYASSSMFRDQIKQICK